MGWPAQEFERVLAMVTFRFCSAVQPIPAPKGRGSPSPGQRPRSCTQVGSLSVSMSCKIAQTGLAVTAPSPSRPSSARNGYLLKRPFKSRPRCVHQRGQRPGEPFRNTNVVGPTGRRFSLLKTMCSQMRDGDWDTVRSLHARSVERYLGRADDDRSPWPQGTQVAWQRNRLARWAEKRSAWVYGAPGRCPSLGEPRAFGPGTYRVSRKKTGTLPTHSDPRSWVDFAQAKSGLVAPHAWRSRKRDRSGQPADG